MFGFNDDSSDDFFTSFSDEEQLSDPVYESSSSEDERTEIDEYIVFDSDTKPLKTTLKTNMIIIGLSALGLFILTKTK